MSTELKLTYHALKADTPCFTEEPLSVFANLKPSELCSFALRLLSKNLLPFVWPHHHKQQQEQECK